MRDSSEDQRAAQPASHPGLDDVGADQPKIATIFVQDRTQNVMDERACSGVGRNETFRPFSELWHELLILCCQDRVHRWTKRVL